MFTVRSRSSQIVGLAVLLTVALQVSNFRFHGSPYGEGRDEPRMIGPREIPSQAGHPIAQPLLNQKQDWPSSPVTFPLASGAGQSAPSTGGRCSGMRSDHGGRSRSTAFRGAG